jgi:hypothetical protein
MNVRRRMKKSAIGATTVTLIPTTAADPEAQPNHAALTQVVLTFAGVPPADIFGTVITDGLEFIISANTVT